MVEETVSKLESEISEKPLVFISHDSRDAELAEAFSKLLKSVSAGMLKSFRSSDRAGTEGIEFGDDWYKRLMVKLNSASDVVCLLTERSLDRPWILYEAGVAKGKLQAPVHGVALGVPLTRVSSGPFYQFQNSDDSEESLTKLVLQLSRRIAGLEPDRDVVIAQVNIFKNKVNEVISKLQLPIEDKKEQPQENEAAVAKVLEEMKLIVRDLPIRIERQMNEGPEPYKYKKMRRLNPMMLDEMVQVIGRRSESPIGLLIIASFFKDDFPWIYELGIEAYRTSKSGNYREMREALRIFQDTAEYTLHGSLFKEMGDYSKEARMQLEDLPRMINRYMRYFEELKMKKPSDNEPSPDEPSNSPSS